MVTAHADGVSAAPATGPPPAAPDRFPHHAALDGLRALALVGVFAHHLGYPWARGGFLAVDLFFVLSGFLITTLLVIEWQGRGTIGVRQFWYRRARRLLPALLVALALVAVFTRLEVDPWSRTAVRGDGLASLLYVANWRFIVEDQGYFQVFSAPSPLRHMWTLAIEEQFYVVWPLVFLVAMKLGKGSLRVLAGVCGVGAALSVAAMVATFGTGGARGGEPLRAYYGTDTRAHTILAGALLAVVLAARPPSGTTVRRLTLAGPVACAALVVTWGFATGTSARYYRGGSMAYAALACMVVASVLHAGPLQKVLARGPVAWVGRLSYGLYLFHWPAIVWLVPTRVPVDGLALDALRVGVTLAVATASYHLVEIPVRERRLPTVVTAARARLRARPTAARWPQERWLVIGGVAATIGIVMASAGGAAPPPSYLVGERPAAADVAAAQDAAVVVAADPDGPDGPSVGAAPGSAAATDDGTWRYGDPLFCGTPRADETDEAASAAGDGGPIGVDGAGARILLVGDSTACSLYPGLAAVGDIVGAEVVEASVFGCGVASGEVTTTRGEQITPNSHRCPTMVDLALDEAAAAGPPDVVVWMSIWEKSDLIVDGEVVDASTEAGREAMLERMDTALGRVAGDVPVALVSVAAPAPNDAQGAANTSNEVDDASYARLDAVLRAFAARHPDQVHVVDLARRLCPDGPPCPEEVGGSAPRPDGRHFTPSAAAEQARWLVPRLLDLAA